MTFISASDEPEIRLLVFTLGLLAIATRENVFFEMGATLFIAPETIRPKAVLEARAIADAVIEEARRLEAKDPPR